MCDAHVDEIGTVARRINSTDGEQRAEAVHREPFPRAAPATAFGRCRGDFAARWLRVAPAAPLPLALCTLPVHVGELGNASLVLLAVGRLGLRDHPRDGWMRAVAGVFLGRR